MTLQRVLITGGAGFIGSHTVDLLLSQGLSVLVLDNLSSGRLTSLPMHHPQLEFVEGDILDYHLLVKLLSGCDAVLHLAAIASVSQSIDHPIDSFRVNTQGFLHVLQAVRQVNNQIRIVYASSAAVYGEAQTLPCRDDVPLIGLPLSPYAVQKMDCETYAHLYAQLYGLSSLGLRYFNVYGQRQDPLSPYSGVMSRFLAAYQQKTAFTLFGDGLQSRDFIEVTDVAWANGQALQSTYTGVLNIATGQPTTLLDVIQCLGTASQIALPIHYAPARAGDIRASYALTEKAKKHLGFCAAVSLQTGIKKLLQPQQTP
jgi:UDP-glucose 4-epimerase